MIDAALESLAIAFSPTQLAFLVIGVMAGLLLGILPGLGGVAGMAILLPFLYGMDAHQGIALLIGLAAANTISDTYPAVLLGIPGSSAGTAIILDGHPLAKQGQAGRALGAAFAATMMGGVLGAALLFASVPFARPIMLAFGTPELFMLTLIGIAMVGVLSSGSGAAGIIAGVVGLLASTVGGASLAAEYRYTFDSLYLFEGLSVPIMALGLYGFPEALDLLKTRMSIARGQRLEPGHGVLRGIRDALRHKWIVARNGALGAFLGVIPGMNGTVVQWFAYGITYATSRDKENFGRGDVRGVVSSESAVNANDSGALVPTLFFGIPVSAGAAMLLVGFSLMGVEAGPSILEPAQLPFVYTAILSLALANIVGCLICLGLTRYMAKLTTIPGTTLAPLVVVMIVVAAYQTTKNWGDLIALLVIGAIGWVMKTIGWPRVPLLIGFVVGSSSERYLGRSMAVYGFDWLLHPTVIVMAVILAAIVVGGIVLQRRSRHTATRDAADVAVPR